MHARKTHLRAKLFRTAEYRLPQLLPPPDGQGSTHPLKYPIRVFFQASARRLELEHDSESAHWVDESDAQGPLLTSTFRPSIWGWRCVVEEDVAFDPVFVGLFGSETIFDIRC
jgi:hypothetical protein